MPIHAVGSRNLPLNVSEDAISDTASAPLQTAVTSLTALCSMVHQTDRMVTARAEL